MNKKQLLSLIAKKQKLAKNEIDILEVLLQKSATAKEILKKTRVSTGRVYPLLKELEEKGLIEKRSTNPAVYSADNFPEKIKNFLNYSFDQLVHTQSEINNALSELEDKLETKIIRGTRAQFDYEIIKMLKEAAWIKIIHKHVSYPWFIYAHNKESFLKIRKAIKKMRLIGSAPEKQNLLLKRDAYLEAYRKKDFEHIMLKNTFEEFKDVITNLLGKKEGKTFLENLHERLRKQKNVKIYLLEKLYTPFSTYLTDKQVLIPMFFRNKENRMIILRGKEIIQTYKDYFEGYKKEGEEIRI